jgi:hypothetical protein
MTRTTAVTHGLALPQRQGSAEVCVHATPHAGKTESRAELVPLALCTRRFFATQHGPKRLRPISALVFHSQSSPARQNKTQ